MADIKQCQWVAPHPRHNWEEQSSMPYGHRQYHYCQGVKAPEHDHAGEAKIWCVTCQHEHIAAIPEYTYLCKDCGWGQWYGSQALEHEVWTENHSEWRHSTYEIHHVKYPMDEVSSALRRLDLVKALIAADPIVIVTDDVREAVGMRRLDYDEPQQ